MILYSGSAEQFINDANFNRIADKLKSSFEDYKHHSVSPGELLSWTNSLQYAKNLLDVNKLHSTMVILEYELPYSSERIDMTIFGKNIKNEDNVVIIELKQWSEVEPCEIGGNVIITYGGNRPGIPAQNNQRNRVARYQPAHG